MICDGHAHIAANVERTGRPHEQAPAPQAKKLDWSSEIEHGTGQRPLGDYLRALAALRVEPLRDPPTLVQRSFVHLPIGFAVGWTRRSETIRLTGRILGASFAKQQHLSNRGPGLSRELTPFEVVSVREAGHLNKARRPVFNTALLGI